jgi:hypothetical protein
VGGGANGSSLSCGADYPNGALSWLGYGPFSLTDATAGDLTFKLWLNSELNHDVLWYGASTNGADFYGSGVSGNSQGWIDRTFDLSNVPTLGNLMGQPVVYIAFIFASDSSQTYPDGAHVDNIVLRKRTGLALAAQEVSPVTQGTPAPSTLIEIPARVLQRR